MFHLKYYFSSCLYDVFTTMKLKTIRININPTTAQENSFSPEPVPPSEL